MQRAIRDTVVEHQRLVQILADSMADRLVAAAEMIMACIRDGGKVLVCGNGGSAADAQHIAGELVGRFRRQRRALPVVALTTDTSVLTAIGNDYSFEQVFVRQVEGLLREGDVLWALSTSGTSANIVAAAQRARSMAGRVLAFTGQSGSPLEASADLCLTVDATRPCLVQEVHQVAYHIVCDLVEQALVDGR